MPNYLRFSQTDGAFVYDSVENTVALDLDLLTSKGNPVNFNPLTAVQMGADPFVEPTLYQLILWYQERQSRNQDSSLFIAASADQPWSQSMSSIIKDGVQTPVSILTSTVQVLRLSPRIPNPSDLI